MEEGERRVRDEINLRLSHPAPTIWEDREIETGLRSVREDSRLKTTCDTGDLVK